MGHFNTEPGASRFAKTPPAWLPVGSQINVLANKWSRRSDIVTFVGTGAGHGAPACFVPAIAEMEVDVALAFRGIEDPVWIDDLTVRDNQFDHPVAMGAVLHEAMHAEHTTWDMLECATEVKDRWEHELITDFEESRIEQRGVEERPKDKAFLRACALHLVIGDLKEDDDFAERGLQSFSKLMLLTMARVDAGVLKKRDVKQVRDAAEKLFGGEVTAKLRSVWRRAQAHRRDGEWRPLHALALEWIKILEDAGHDPRKESEVPQWLKDLLQGMVGMPMETDENGDPVPGTGMPGILIVMAEETETEAGDDVTDQAVAEAAEAIASKAAEEAAEKDVSDKAAEQVFGRGTGPGPHKTNSKLVEERDPTGAERAAAVKLAKDLERAQYRDRVATKTSRAAPPGRLRPRAAMAGAAARQRGDYDRSEPWKATVRKHTDDPELRIGMMTDISGSMSSAMRPMGITNWVVSEAARRVQGRIGSVYFGNDVFAGLAPGQHLDKVAIYSAPDGTERFDKAFRALDSRVGLLDHTGARLLIVVSDLWHRAEEKKAHKKWFARCRAEGVAVIVIVPEAGMLDNAKESVGRFGTVIAIDPSDPVAVAAKIGQAAVKELQAASR